MVPREDIPLNKTEPQSSPRATRLDRALLVLERVGNRLPEPVTLFALLCVVVAIASSIAARVGWQAVHPKDGSVLLAVDLLTPESVRRMFTEAVRNFTSFAPLGLVLVAMLGMGVAEGSGFIAAALRGLVARIPPALLTAAIVFVGVNGNLAADAGVIVLPPLAALLFLSVGRHPVAGIAAAFAGVAGGFSANLLPSALDAVLAGLSQSALDAARLMPGYKVQVLGNWYFLFVSTFVLTLVGTWVTERIVEPYLGPWRGERPAEAPVVDPREGRALLWAGLSMLGCLGLFAWWTLGPGAPLRLPEGGWIDSLRPLFDSIVVLVAILFFVPGLVFGAITGSIRNDRDVARMAADGMASMAGYIVLAFFAAQFVNWFAWSNLAAILAVKGAGFLRGLGFGASALMVGIVLGTAMLNLLTSSASAKWGLIGPVFVPMFLLLGFSPEGTQVIYRVGDSATNIITPLFPYMPIILAAVRRYLPEAGVGKLIAVMVPYSIAFLLSWTLLLLLWSGMDWPIGPGVLLHLR